MGLCFEDKRLRVGKFEQFHALIERWYCKKFKCIYTSKSNEYYRFFDVFYTQRNISHEKTSPKTLYLNGLVERINKALIEKVKLLTKTKLPKYFWDVTLYNAMHVIILV